MINAAWLVWLGLNRLGYTDEAETLSAGLARAVATSGLREYYDPYDGKGMGATDFRLVVADHRDARPRLSARGSYLDAG